MKGDNWLDVRLQFLAVPRTDVLVVVHLERDRYHVSHGIGQFLGKFGISNKLLGPALCRRRPDPSETDKDQAPQRDHH